MKIFIDIDYAATLVPTHRSVGTSMRSPRRNFGFIVSRLPELRSPQRYEEDALRRRQ